MFRLARNYVIALSSLYGCNTKDFVNPTVKCESWIHSLLDSFLQLSLFLCRIFCGGCLRFRAEKKERTHLTTERGYFYNRRIIYLYWTAAPHCDSVWLSPHLYINAVIKQLVESSQGWKTASVFLTLSSTLGNSAIRVMSQKRGPFLDVSKTSSVSMIHNLFFKSGKQYKAF